MRVWKKSLTFSALVLSSFFSGAALAQVTTVARLFASSLLNKDVDTAKKMIFGSIGRNSRTTENGGDSSITVDEFFDEISRCEMHSIIVNSPYNVRIVMKCGFDGIQFRASDAGEKVAVSDYGPIYFAPPPPPLPKAKIDG